MIAKYFCRASAMREAKSSEGGLDLAKKARQDCSKKISREPLHIVYVQTNLGVAVQKGRKWGLVSIILHRK